MSDNSENKANQETRTEAEQKAYTVYQYVNELKRIFSADKPIIKTIDGKSKRPDCIYYRRIIRLNQVISELSENSEYSSITKGLLVEDVIDKRFRNTGKAVKIENVLAEGKEFDTDCRDYIDGLCEELEKLKWDIAKKVIDLKLENAIKSSKEVESAATDVRNAAQGKSVEVVGPEFQTWAKTCRLQGWLWLAGATLLLAALMFILWFFYFEARTHLMSNLATGRASIVEIVSTAMIRMVTVGVVLSVLFFCLRMYRVMKNEEISWRNRLLIVKSYPLFVHAAERGTFDRQSLQSSIIELAWKQVATAAPTGLVKDKADAGKPEFGTESATLAKTIVEMIPQIIQAKAGA